MRSLEKNIFIVFLIGLVYFSTSTGAILGSNDGSQYALLRTVLDTGHLEITQFINYTNYVNVAYYNGGFYSDRAPGTLLITTPFYLFGKLTSFIFGLDPDPYFFELPQRINEDLSYSFPAFSVLMIFSLLPPILFGAGCVLLVYYLAKMLSDNTKASMVAAFLYGFGTIAWRYSTVLFSHILSAFSLLLGVYLLIYIFQKRKFTPLLLLATAFCFGYLSILEYQNLLYFAGIAIYLYLNRYIAMQHTTKKIIFLVLTGYFIPVSLMWLFHYFSFDNPFKNGYSYHYVYDWARNFKDLFSGNFLDGFTGLLFSRMRDGIFISSPFLVFGIIGLKKMTIKYKNEAMLFLSLVLVPILVIAKEKEWHGGFDHRYVLPTIAFLAIPASFFLNEAKSRISLIIFYIVAFYSVLFQIKEIPEFIQRTALFLPLFNKGGILGTYLPGIALLPYYFFFCTLIYIAYLIVLYLKRNDFSFDSKTYAKIFVIGILFLLNFFYLRQTANAKYARDDFHIYDSFRDTSGAITNAVVESGIVHPANYDVTGYLTYEIKFEKAVCRLNLVPKGIIYKHGKIDVFVDDQKENKVFSFSGRKNESTIHPYIDLTPYAKNKNKMLITISLDVAKGAKALYDARLTSIDIGGRYCE